MFQAIRKHLTPSTLIAFAALIFAATGGAFAATGGSGSPAKQIASTARVTSNTATAAKAKPKTKAGPRGPAGPAGKTGATGATGAAGPAGPAGPAGAKGENGAAGSNGTSGTNGESVTNTAAKNCGSAGGAEFRVGSGAATKACNGAEGKEGSFGTGTTLPEGKTLAGHWAATGYGETGDTEPGVGHAIAAVSFALPLLKTVGTSPGEYKKHLVKEGEPVPSECTGDGGNPESLNLCVYIGNTINAADGGAYPGLDADKTGFTVSSFTEAKGSILIEGTWAVTG